MTHLYSPLRYPGGKAVLYGKVKEIFEKNALNGCSYREPFAGGCGLALKLLLNGDVKDIHINDNDPFIWSFWHCVLHKTEELIEKINTTTISLEEWYIQKEISPETADVLSTGFAALFLNRTNRSGIIKNAGPIGGKGQIGTYKIDCRFNKGNIIERILCISKQKERIHLTQLDAQEFLLRYGTDENTFVYMDPPYFKKGKGLYTSFYQANDHHNLENIISQHVKAPWLITYDNVEEIKFLYKQYTSIEFSLQYSLQKKRQATELMIFSPKIKIPQFAEKNIGSLLKAA
ncbi:DNA adenine methylase [Bartonella sp. AR 15-3]|uniref:DNA adenine methylase n=1 Tax=Bartonella sp. AR 15-3 TaxID=545617 RepID=UPI0001F4C255|nr:DNA adenine methylase [Bartonella sp. AR 15-3]OPB31551.1 DNA adenine methylase [Bartonella sp. AR 15-3]CBI79431.1 DNA methyltransferase [Bartonella sp. AR 15-3]